MFHVPLQDFFEGSQQPHKALSFDEGQFAGSLGDHVGSPRRVFEKGQLAEVIAGLILPDFLGWSSIKRFSSDSLSRDNEVEPVAILGVPFGDNLIVGLEILLPNYICDLRSLVVVETL